MTSREQRQGLIEVAGADARNFLHRVLSQDIKSLRQGQKILACLLDSSARIISVMTVCAFENHFALELDIKLKDKTLGALEQFIISDDVKLVDRSSSLLLPQPAAEASRIEAGIPKYGVDFDETNIPLECRFESAVSFSKGCFPGQEILARLDSRGGVSKKLVRLSLCSIPSPPYGGRGQGEGEVRVVRGDQIMTDGKEIGWITSAAYSTKHPNQIVALGYVKKGYWDSKAALTIQMKTQSISAFISGWV